MLPNIVNMKSEPTINEKWLQERLTDNPELLGLGELRVRDSERRQPSGGRLDLLMEHIESRTRYEIEIQLGAMDESHIIRAIEYWDIERRRYPQYKHIAVIVAEDVTSRFLNVISLFNGAIPLIAIQLRGVEVNGEFTMVATRVVDVVELGIEEEDEGETVDRPFWEQKSSVASMDIVDKLVQMVGKVEQGALPRYNKHYIGLEFNGQARNFVSFGPRKSSYVLTEFRISHDLDLTALLDNSGLETVEYDTRYGRYRVRVFQSDFDVHSDILLELIRRARETYHGS